MAESEGSRTMSTKTNMAIFVGLLLLLGTIPVAANSTQAQSLLPPTSMRHPATMPEDDPISVLRVAYALDSYINSQRIESANEDPLFSEVETGLPISGLGSLDWGDYDNDGDLDLLLTGHISDTLAISRVYENRDGILVDSQAGLIGVFRSSTAWGDYNNDACLDIITTGEENTGVLSTRLYRGDCNGSFTHVPVGLPGVHSGAVTWGDYNNDGRLDILLVGRDSADNGLSRIYRNNGQESFTDIDAGLPGMWYADAAWGDYDNDGYLDVLLTGSTLTLLYHNNGDETFSNINAGLQRLRYSSAAWGDYNNDGYLDALLTGYDYYSSSFYAKVYRNDGGNVFTDIGAALESVWHSRAKWGDYDNDGDLDILLIGLSSSGESISAIYRNDGADTFVDIDAQLCGAHVGDIAWGDYDNDGDLDFILAGRHNTDEPPVTILYRNNITNTNTVPVAPEDLDSVFDSATTVTLNWHAGGDSQTPAAGLTYNVRVGTTPGGSEVIAPMSLPQSGTRTVPALGNAGHRLFIRLQNVTPGAMYYWSVQAVDTAFAGSNFAAESQFRTPVVPTQVTLQGPQLGVVNQHYTYTATVFPDNVTLPVTYTWTPEPVLGQNTTQATFTWTTGGTQTVEVAASNPYGAVQVAKEIQIYTVPESIAIQGPTEGVVGQTNSFVALISPSDASAPVRYTWSPEPLSGQQTPWATYLWNAGGVITITVTGTHVDGMLRASHAVTVTDAEITGLSFYSSSPTPLGAATYFTASVISGTNIQYTWDFGDGPEHNLSKHGSLFGNTTMHVYNEVGSYQVTVTATNSVSQITTSDAVEIYGRVFLPLILRTWPPIPSAPQLYSVDNADQNQFYSVNWSSTDFSEMYVLEEATDSSFLTSREVYSGNGTTWSVPYPGKTPNTYYYRVKALNAWGDSNWSNVNSVIIHPLFVGLQLRWDGNGYIRGSEYRDVGSHKTKNLDGLTDADTIRVRNYNWYDPNPYNFPAETWDSFYSVTTGHFRSSSAPDDPSWKWGYYWILPNDVMFFNGQTAIIDGQAFIVSGPHSGYTAFGIPVQYWRLVNRDRFLFWDGGGSWTQYVHAGDITLHYDAGNTRLLLHNNTLRREYYNGQISGDTVQYITNLTSANSFAINNNAAVEIISTKPQEDLQKPSQCCNGDNANSESGTLR